MASPLFSTTRLGLLLCSPLALAALPAQPQPLGTPSVDDASCASPVPEGLPDPATLPFTSVVGAYCEVLGNSAFVTWNGLPQAVGYEVVVLVPGALGWVPVSEQETPGTNLALGFAQTGVFAVAVHGWTSSGKGLSAAVVVLSVTDLSGAPTMPSPPQEPTEPEPPPISQPEDEPPPGLPPEEAPATPDPEQDPPPPAGAEPPPVVDQDPAPPPQPQPPPSDDGAVDQDGGPPPSGSGSPLDGGEEEPPPSSPPPSGQEPPAPPAESPAPGPVCLAELQLPVALEIESALASEQASLSAELQQVTAAVVAAEAKRDELAALLSVAEGGLLEPAAEEARLLGIVAAQERTLEAMEAVIEALERALAP